MEQEQTSQFPPARTARDRRGKMAFVGVIIVVGLVIYLNQRKDPQLPGWDGDLAAATAQAKAGGGKVVLLFLHSPMTETDKRIVGTLTRADSSVRVLEALKWPHVRLWTSDKRAAQYAVTETPTLLLLDGDGKIIRRKQDYLNDLQFCNDFLGVSPSQASTMPK